MAGLRRKFLTVDGIEYSYFERAGVAQTDIDGRVREPTTLLFLHGFTANKTMWMVMSKYLPKEWRIVMLDMPGHGESSFKPNNDYSALGLAEKIHSVSLFVCVFAKRWHHWFLCCEIEKCIHVCTHTHMINMCFPLSNGFRVIMLEGSCICVPVCAMCSDDVLTIICMGHLQWLQHFT